jgi:hypothetical protein
MFRFGRAFADRDCRGATSGHVQNSADECPGESHNSGMRLRDTLLAVVLLAFLAPVASAQTASTDPVPPNFRVLVIVRSEITASFDALVLKYVDLRTMLEEGLPALHVTDNPAENIAIQRELARRIRRARDRAVRGDIFTPAISGEFRRILFIEMNPGALAAIMDDNPGALSSPAINASYPSGMPRATMPGLILAVLPGLPDGLEYRFLGHHLILHDTRANVILDRISCAIACLEVVD